MSVPISSTAPVIGYFPADEPSFTGTREELLASISIYDVPQAGAPGGYVSRGIKGQDLADLLLGNWNAQKNPLKVVRTYADLLQLNPLSCCRGTKGVVLDDTPGYPAGDYPLLYTDHANAWNYVCQDGTFDQNPDNLTDAAWFAIDSPEAGVPAYSQLSPAYSAGPPLSGYAFAVDELVRAFVPGSTTEQFFAALTPAGPRPAPSNAGGDSFWRVVNRGDVPASAGIPLTGTTPGNPITGALSFFDAVNLRNIVLRAFDSLNYEFYDQAGNSLGILSFTETGIQLPVDGQLALSSAGGDLALLTCGPGGELLVNGQPIAGSGGPVRDIYAVPATVRDAVRNPANSWSYGDLTNYNDAGRLSAGAPPFVTGQAAGILVGTADVKEGDTFDAFESGSTTVAWRYTYARRNTGTSGWTRIAKTA